MKIVRLALLSMVLISALMAPQISGEGVKKWGLLSGTTLEGACQYTITCANGSSASCCNDLSHCCSACSSLCGGACSGC
jgi:hypothetical protein